jgi:hypothetical protein
MKDPHRLLLIFGVTCIAAVVSHELGHAVAGWAQGIPVVPMPAKIYILQEQVEWHQRAWISLGGVVATSLLLIVTIVWYAAARSSAADVILAGAVVPVCAYTARFLIAGRGHDGLEWQQAQVAVGASLSGHGVDVLFLGLFLAGGAAWIVRRHSSIQPLSFLKAAGLMLLGGAILVVLQVVNNALLDPLFPATQTVNVPPTPDLR